MITIRTDKPKDMEAFFSKAKNDSKGNGITWSGDMSSGSIEGFGIQGNYIIDANYITVNITKKPPLISRALIEKEIVKYINT